VCIHYYALWDLSEFSIYLFSVLIPPPKRGKNEISTENAAKTMTLIAGILRIGCFFAVMALTAFGLDALINTGLRRVKTSEFGALNRSMSGAVNAEILVTGSSRALAHYDPSIIQSITGKTTYNLGLNGSHTDMQLGLLKAYLRHNAKPEILVHNLDTHSLLSTEDDLYHPGLYLPYLAEDDLYRALKDVRPDVWKWKWIPLYGYAVEDMNFTWVDGLKGFFGINPREDFFLGYNPRKPVWTDEFEHLKENHPSGVRIGINRAGEEAMQNLIELCRQRGIRLILVYSPEYHEMQELTINRAEIFAKFEDLARRYQVPFWDYSKSSFSQDRKFFNNSQHMNVDGATAFSRDLAHRIAAFVGAEPTVLSKEEQASPNGKVLPGTGAFSTTVTNR
jgi:hypothetical protein